MTKRVLHFTPAAFARIAARFEHDNLARPRKQARKIARALQEAICKAFGPGRREP